jgi:hypothetical protein
MRRAHPAVSIKTFPHKLDTSKTFSSVHIIQQFVSEIATHSAIQRGEPEATG